MAEKESEADRKEDDKRYVKKSTGVKRDPKARVEEMRMAKRGGE